MFLTGPDCDIQANEFVEALSEIGVGLLEHPIDGLRKVIPTGRISRRDNLKSAANQVILDVTFWETLTDVDFPEAVINVSEKAQADTETAQTQTAAQFPTFFDVTIALESVTAQNYFVALVDIIKGGLQDLAQVEQGIRSQFDALSAEIQNNIDSLIGDPLQLALKMIDLTRLPARAVTDIKAKLDAYNNLLNTILSSNFIASFNNTAQNSFFSSAIVAGAVLMAISESLQLARFRTKPEAIVGADNMLSALDLFNEWFEDNAEALSIIDSGEMYQALFDMTISTSSNLVAISFSLLQERVIALDRPRALVELTAELYGEVEDKLDEIIAVNDLVGNEILELPEGREIRYYV
jgi:prophage DNA circulation protein